MKSTSVLALAATVAALGVQTPVQAARLPTPQVAVIPAASLVGVTDLGPASGAKVEFSLVLPYRHAQELPALLKLQATPGSPYYHRYLSAAHFREYFSPTPAAYAAAAAQLVAAGFKVETFANRTVLHATGSAAAAAQFFGTAIHSVRQADGRVAYANVRPAVVPLALRGAHVTGLSSVIVARTAVSAAVRTRRVATSYGGALFGPDGGFGPLAIAKSEDLPVVHRYRGANSNVADLVDGAVPDSDVAGFLTYFGIARKGPRTTQIAVDGGCGASCADGLQAAIDAEWILAVAPDASLFTYQIPALTNAGIADGFNAIVSDDAVNVVNFAVGACEINGGDLQLALTPLIAQGAAEGITFESVAFGGANLCSLGVDLPMTPANLDTLTAVGGSNAFVDASGKLLAQSAYPSSNGGVSATVDVPAWQSATKGVSPAGRNVPDLVLPAEVDGVGPSYYYGGQWAGGSAFVNNAPFAGYLATVQQMYGYTTPLGNVAPSIYATFDQSGYADFSDVALGNIGAINGTPVSAGTGYDVATGIGSISAGFALAKSLGYGTIQPAP